MLLLILISAAVLLLLVLIIAATRPDQFRLQRSIGIKAPPEKVFALINDFHRWGAWSPWEKLDPALQRSFSGTAAGVGSIYNWQGNAKVGTGRMEILASAPASKITIRLDFLKPFEAHNTAEFTLEQNGDLTQVTWCMAGPSSYISKLMGLFISMDSMVGKDFEAGLANIKALAEQQAGAIQP